MTNWEKLIAGKVRLAAKGSLKSLPKTSDVLMRVPAGQTEVKNFPILDLGILPNINQDNWRLRLFGLVEHEINLDWAAYHAIRQVESISDFHCVTRWTRLDMNWVGVKALDIVSLAAPLAHAKFVTLHGYDGYTTNLPFAALQDDDVIIAHSVLGYPLTTAHGGPVRIVVPKRYAWKGAKWLKAIEFHAEDRLGFWELRGYHNEADPFKEQRFTKDGA